MVEKQGLQRMVLADSVAGCFGGQLGAFRRLIRGVAAGLVGGNDKRIVVGAWDDEKFGHGFVCNYEGK